MSRFWTRASETRTDLTLAQATLDGLLGRLRDLGATGSRRSDTIVPGQHVAKQYERV